LNSKIDNKSNIHYSINTYIILISKRPKLFLTLISIRWNYLFNYGNFWLVVTRLLTKSWLVYDWKSTQYSLIHYYNTLRGQVEGWTAWSWTLIKFQVRDQCAIDLEMDCTHHCGQSNQISPLTIFFIWTSTQYLLIHYYDTLGVQVEAWTAWSWTLLRFQVHDQCAITLEMDSTHHCGQSNQISPLTIFLSRLPLSTYSFIIIIP